MEAARGIAMSAAGLFVVDAQGRIVEWSDGAAALLGLPAGEALGRRCREAVVGRDPRSGAPVCGRACPPLAALGAGRLSGSVRLLAGRAASPRPLRCELIALPERPGGAIGRLSPEGAGGPRGRRAGPDVVHDLSALARLATSLAAEPFPRSLDRALSVVREATGMESAEVFLADPARRELLLAAYAGPFPSAFCEVPRFRPGEGLPGLVLAARAPAVATALDRDARYVRASVTAKGFRCGVWAPLVGSDGPVGVIGATSRRRHLDPAPEQVRLLTWAGCLLGSALETSMLRLREELRSAAEAPEEGDAAGLDRLLRATVERALEIGEADAGGLALLDRRGLGAVRFVTAGRAPGRACPGLLAGCAATCPCPVVAVGSGATFDGPRRSWPLPCRLVRPAGVARSCVPITAGRVPVGVIHLVHTRHRPSPPTRDLALLLALADGAGRAVACARDRAERQPAIVVQAAGEARAAPAAAEPYLVVRCLGAFELRRGGVLVTPEMVRRRKALTLLKVLLVHAGRPVSCEALGEALWPGASPGLAAGRLHVVVHALRRVLEPGGPARRASFVRSTHDAYRLEAGGSFWLDVSAFEAAVARGRSAERSGALDEAIAAYEAAADLYRGHLLEDEPGADWCELERGHLREMLLDVLTGLGALHAREGDLDRSIRCCRRALRVDPLREQVHRRLIESLWRAGRRDEALRQYRACREVLRQELGVAPLPETDRLAERVRSGPPRSTGA